MKYFVLALTVFTFCFPWSRAYAVQNDFTYDTNVHYGISSDGRTTVTYDITIKNQSSLAYPREYQMTVDSPNVTQVVAYDPKGSLEPKVSHVDEATVILVTFNHTSVGIGSNLTFTIRYQTNDIARKDGNIWEISIPPAPNDPGITGYNVSFDAPPDFGPLAYIYPKPKSGRKWHKDQLVNQRITAVFGESQNYKLTLRYHLNNSSLLESNQDIRFPPDAAFQNVVIASIDPLPLFVTRDSNGHWVGRYSVAPKSNFDIKAIVYVRVTMVPRLSPVQENDVKPVIDQTTYVTASDSAILALGSDLGTLPNIYAYVTGTLSYDYTKAGNERINRTASEALRNPKQSTVSDFTGTFLALSQATGLPVRIVNGMAISRSPITEPVSPDDSMVHDWVEYFDQDLHLWLPVDPTWGNTSDGKPYLGELDFRHIALTVGEPVAGDDSAIPVKTNWKAGDISYEIMDTPLPPDIGKLTGTLKFPFITASGFNAGGSLTIKNLTGLRVHTVHATVQSQTQKFYFETTQNDLPPYSEKSVKIRVPSDSLYSFGKEILFLTLNDEITQYSYYKIPFVPIILILLILLILVKLFIKIMKSVRVSEKPLKQKKAWKFKKIH